MVNTREEAVQASLKTTVNEVGSCQKTTRTWFDVPSAGDYDRDGDADAVDGWKMEPARYKHPGDRNPPRGVPLSFSGGSKGYGHRCISLGNGLARSTDMEMNAYSPGKTNNTTIEAIEKHMGVHYLGWSETCDGTLIPNPPLPKTDINRFRESRPHFDVNLLDRAIHNGRKGLVLRVRNDIDREIKLLPHDKGNTRVNQVVSIYNKDHILRMDLLNKAVKNGRVGRVKAVRDRLRKLIHELPPR